MMFDSASAAGWCDCLMCRALLYLPAPCIPIMWGAIGVCLWARAAILWRRPRLWALGRRQTFSFRFWSTSTTTERLAQRMDADEQLLQQVVVLLWHQQIPVTLELWRRRERLILRVEACGQIELLNLPPAEPDQSSEEEVFFDGDIAPEPHPEPSLLFAPLTGPEYPQCCTRPGAQLPFSREPPDEIPAMARGGLTDIRYYSVPEWRSHRHLEGIHYGAGATAWWGMLTHMGGSIRGQRSLTLRGFRTAQEAAAWYFQRRPVTEETIPFFRWH